jgi:hypothetical protein
MSLGQTSAANSGLERTVTSRHRHARCVLKWIVSRDWLHTLMQCAGACCRCHQNEPSNQTGIGENQLASYSNSQYGSPTQRMKQALDSWCVPSMTPATACWLNRRTHDPDRMTIL